MRTIRYHLGFLTCIAMLKLGMLLLRASDWLRVNALPVASWGQGEVSNG